MTAGPAPSWSALLDRLEERFRLVEASATATGEPPEIGPAPHDADVPAEAPTPEERLRLLALLAAHDRVLERLDSRRRLLRRATHYRLGAV